MKEAKEKEILDALYYYCYTKRLLAVHEIAG